MGKKTESRSALITWRVLVGMLFTVITILAAGTVYGLVKKGPGNKNVPAGDGDPGETERIFSGLGTIRAATAGEESESIIVSIVFPYNSADRAFSEELVSRIEELKRLTVEYLGSVRAEELQDIDGVGAGLLTRYNALLRLGQIRELYFLEFIWL